MRWSFDVTAVLQLDRLTRNDAGPDPKKDERMFPSLEQRLETCLLEMPVAC